MNVRLNAYAEGTSFRRFLFTTLKVRRLLVVGIIASIAQWVIFKWFYPYPNFINGDSFQYILSARDNSDINTYMIGYAKFLRFFSCFTSSDVVLVTFQYTFIQLSCLFFVITLMYFYSLNGIVSSTLLFFVVVNPLNAHLGNLVSSDGLFLSLSLLWIATLVWCINAKSIKSVIWHSLTLFLAFTVRYNALFYPFISSIAIFLVFAPMRMILISLFICFFPCLLFVFRTSQEYKALTGYRQYSPFSGWQLANNAMYAYQFIDSSERKVVPERFHRLDMIVRRYFDSTRSQFEDPNEAVKANTMYMWKEHTPLYDYLSLIRQRRITPFDFQEWAKIAPFYAAYGRMIISLYPNEYLSYFVRPNAAKYFSPPLEFLKIYNSGFSTIPPSARDWFGFNTNRLKTRINNPVQRILEIYSVMNGVLVVLSYSCLACFFILYNSKANGSASKLMMIFLCCLLANTLFSIISTSGALRFQAFFIVVMLSIVGTFIDWLLKDASYSPRVHIELSK